MERTLVILKPDAVSRKLTGEIISRFEKRNLKISRIKLETISIETAEEHYAHVKAESIYDEMMKFITSGPSMIMIVEGNNVIQLIRKMIGVTNSFESIPGTIRGDYSSHRYENLIHASDSMDSAEEEIGRFFKEIS